MHRFPAKPGNDAYRRPILKIRWEEADISRVLFSAWQASRGWLSIWDVCHQTPQADWQKRVAPLLGAGKRPTVAPSTLLPAGVYRASASQRCWCALTAPLHPYLLCPSGHLVPTRTQQAVFFCGTILTLARTRRYLASLVFREPGLSSDLMICNLLRLLFPSSKSSRLPA